MKRLTLELLQLANAASDEADRCANNALTAGTWIEKDFRGIADQLYDIVTRMEKKKPPPSDSLSRYRKAGAQSGSQK